MQPLYVALFRIEETPGGNLQQTAEECGDVTFPRAVLAHDYTTEEHTRRHLAAKGEEPALCPAVRLSDPSSCSAPCIECTAFRPRQCRRWSTWPSSSSAR